MLSAFENNSFYNYSLLFVSEIDILPTEITKSPRVSLKQTGRLDGQFLVDLALCCMDHVSLSQKKLPYTGSCLQWMGVRTHLDMMSLYIFV